eukprot:scaffold7567_cov104-Isochrysis_galbana.AAC.3
MSETSSSVNVYAQKEAAARRGEKRSRFISACVDGSIIWSCSRISTSLGASTLMYHSGGCASDDTPQPASSLSRSERQSTPDRATLAGRPASPSAAVRPAAPLSAMEAASPPAASPAAAPLGSPMPTLANPALSPPTADPSAPAEPGASAPCGARTAGTSSAAAAMPRDGGDLPSPANRPP